MQGCPDILKVDLVILSMVEGAIMSILCKVSYFRVSSYYQDLTVRIKRLHLNKDYYCNFVKLTTHTEITGYHMGSVINDELHPY